MHDLGNDLGTLLILNQIFDQNRLVLGIGVSLKPEGAIQPMRINIKGVLHADFFRKRVHNLHKLLGVDFEVPGILGQV